MPGTYDVMAAAAKVVLEQANDTTAVSTSDIPIGSLVLNEILDKKSAVTLDINIGDTILGGRFKNKKIVVKKFGRDENNQYTVNDRKLLSYRIEKFMPGKGDDKKNKKDWGDKKSAQFDYTIDGSNLQAVGLRKTLHKIFDQKNINGLAVNNAYTGGVELSLKTKTQKQAEDIIKSVRNKVMSEFNTDIKFKKNRLKRKYKRVNLGPNELELFNKAGNLNYVRSKLYDPNTAELMNAIQLKDELQERFRLKEQSGRLKGYVPARAYRQLKGLEPIYKNFIPENLVRDMAEGLSLQEYHASGLV